MLDRVPESDHVEPLAFEARARRSAGNDTQAELPPRVFGGKGRELDAGHVVVARGGMQEESGGAAHVEQSPARDDLRERPSCDGPAFDPCPPFSQVVVEDLVGEIGLVVELVDDHFGGFEVNLDETARKTAHDRIAVLLEEGLMLPQTAEPAAGTPHVSSSR